MIDVDSLRWGLFEMRLLCCYRNIRLGEVSLELAAIQSMIEQELNGIVGQTIGTSTIPTSSITLIQSLEESEVELKNIKSQFINAFTTSSPIDSSAIGMKTSEVDHSIVQVLRNIDDNSLDLTIALTDPREIVRNYATLIASFRNEKGPISNIQHKR